MSSTPDDKCVQKYLIGLTSAWVPVISNEERECMMCVRQKIHNFVLGVRYSKPSVDRSHSNASLPMFSDIISKVTISI